MSRPAHRISPSTIVFLLATVADYGLTWMPYSISRLTSRSVFVRLRTGEAQLCRRSLERHGRIDTVSGTFSLESFALPRERDGPACPESLRTPERATGQPGAPQRQSRHRKESDQCLIDSNV